ncbi:MAG TPA: hypothetical protein V6D22_01620 [Candidatus Obscuribacterales bacterium]
MSKQTYVPERDFNVIKLDYDAAFCAGEFVNCGPLKASGYTINMADTNAPQL